MGLNLQRLGIEDQEGSLGKARETLYTMGGAEEPDNKMGHIHGFRPNVVNY